jgi:hypothetical protein
MNEVKKFVTLCISAESLLQRVRFCIHVNIQGDSKLSSVFPWPINRNPDNN